MPRTAMVLIALSLALLPRPVRAEAVYEFVAHCRQERLGDCFDSIRSRLDSLNAGTARRICLPRAFGGVVLERGVLPVSLLEHVRVKLSAARFGEAGANVDDVMTRIVNQIYPCR